MDIHSFDDFVEAIKRVGECWNQVVDSFSEAFSTLWEDIVETLEDFVEILDEVVLYQPKQKPPIPPRSIFHKSYVMDKRSNIRQYSYFRR